MGKLDEFFSAASKPVLGGNTAWASSYARELKRVVHEQAARAPRSLQSHLGPSELGAQCDRMVAAKMARLPTTNHVSDPWPSVVGTAIHAWLADAFDADNERHEYLRWVTEQRVEPHPLHPGTADLYDAFERSVVDHKCLAESSLSKVRSANGPPRHYVVQMLLYARGYRLLGLPVDRVALAAYPRTASSLDGLYVWERPYTPADDELLKEVFEQTEVRRQWAAALITGSATLGDVPAHPDDHECMWCLAGETEVVTRQGLKSIRELAGTEPELLIPANTAHTRWGGFKSVPISSFGTQSLYAVNLKRYRATKTIYTTREHRWILSSGDEVSSVALKPGDQLSTVKARKVIKAERIDVGVAQGFIYGDGGRGTGHRPATLNIYGRSEKVVMLEFFAPRRVGISYTPTDDMTHNLYGLPRFWKDLPPLDESRSFLLSWLAGYFAADGTVDKNGGASISSADPSAISFIRNVASICGVGHGQPRTKTRLGCNGKMSDLHTISLTTRDLPSWFWILPEHVIRSSKLCDAKGRDTNWSVVSVESTDRVEEVFCATVPEIGAFGLADGLTTGNCPQYRPQAAKDGGTGCPGTAGRRK